MQLAEQYCDDRLVSVLEGGYTLDGLASAVKVHVETLTGQSFPHVKIEHENSNIEKAS